MSLFCKTAGSLFGLTGEQIVSEIEMNSEHNSASEKNSWRISLPKLISVLQRAGLDNVYVAAEYELPAGGRIDATIIGDDSSGKHIALIVELKQWSFDGIEYNEAYGFPVIKVNAKEPYLTRHPVTQTDEYVSALNSNHSNVLTGDIKVQSCQYLHDFEKDKKEFFIQGMFADMNVSNMYLAGEENEFINFLLQTFDKSADNNQAVQAFVTGEYVTTEMDMEIINKITESPENIPLWHDQTAIMDYVMFLLKRQARNELTQKHLVVVRGAAGTGKTIVGFRMLAEYWNLHKGDNQYNCAYTLPRSRTIKQVLDGLSNESAGVKAVFLNNLALKKRDLLVVDEGHRITELKETGILLVNTQIVIVLQDDNQRVLGNEIGTYNIYKKFAADNGFTFTKFDLNYQKRSGLGSYVDRLDKLLYGKNYTNDVGLGIDVKIFDSLQEFEAKMIDTHNSNKSIKYYAPYCWPWNSRSKPGEIDIKIPDGGYEFTKSWNPMHNQYEWYLDSIDQVGCVYTAQGLGYDYVGFIWWEDLVWRTDHWETDIKRVTEYDLLLKNSLNDSGNYDYLLFNIYRVLLTRAKKGIYIWFKDKETKEHFLSIVGQSNIDE